ncbi:MAG TPA: hypothetical protein VJ792_03860, partial [Candidatus Nitrosotalea sp.]|nr:hypothetical protein [Candidatus Nitrosotalea sp.]
MKNTTPQIICAIILSAAISFAAASAQTYPNDIAHDAKISSHAFPLSDAHSVSKNMHGVKILYSGVVNVTKIKGAVHAPRHWLIPPPRTPYPRTFGNISPFSGQVPSIGKIPTAVQTPMSSTTSSKETLRVSNDTFVGFEQNMTNPSYPPDVQVAASPDFIMEAVNLEGGIWAKHGTPLAQFPLSSFFTLSESHLISDPRILYDSQSGRWFAAMIDGTNNTVSVAVSQTGNPLGGWHVYKIPYSNPCIDFPKIGTSNDKFVVSTNDFTQGCQEFANSEMVVLDKKEMLDHDSYIGSSDLTDTNFSVTPARSLGPT